MCVTLLSRLWLLFYLCFDIQIQTLSCALLRVFALGASSCFGGTGGTYVPIEALGAQWIHGFAYLLPKANKKHIELRPQLHTME